MLSTHKEFSDYRFENSVAAMKTKDNKKLLHHMEKLRGLRLGFTLHDPMYLKFREHLIQHIQSQRLDEQEHSKCLENLFHIGIKDPELSQVIFADIKANFDYFSFNALLRSVTFWQDLDMYGERLLIQESLKKRFFSKVKAVYRKFSQEDLAQTAFVLDGWNVPIDPLMDLMKQIDYDELNSKKSFSLNTYPKVLSLLARHNLEKEALKVMDQFPVLSSLAYEQNLQDFELSDAYQMDIGVYDPLHWRSIGLYTQAILALKLDSRDMMNYIEEAIARKFECQLCDLSEAVDILKGSQASMLPANRVMVIQMLNNLIHKEPDHIPYQLTPQKLIDLVQTLADEIKLEEISAREVYLVLNRLLELLLEERFDAQLEEGDHWTQLKSILSQVPDQPDMQLQAALEHATRRIEL